MSLLSRLAVSAARAYGALSSNPNAVSASYLVVAGGGSGSASHGGGGGAGGYQTSTFTLSTLNTYTVTIGAGGVASGIQGAVGFDGSTSSISGTGLSTISSGGGGGGGAGFNSSSCVGRNGLATNGNGGGAGGGTTSSGQAGGSGNGAGFAGGSMVTNGTAGAGGGGGGAGAVGANATGSGSGGATGGIGGVGLSNSITGSSVFYAGGGGGAGWTTNGAAGGNGGGGAGGNPSVKGVNGTANTGGGGGGSGDGSSTTGGNGGSGIVIISYTSATPKFVGGTLTTSGGNQIHTFTSSGTLSPLTPVTASYLVVAGGGGGNQGFGGGPGGGGGAGGLLTSSTTLYSGATYVVTVGGGGAGSSAGSAAAATSGSNSVLSGTGITTVTSTGGGGAGTTTGQNGGSGAGANSNGGTGGTGTSGQGNNGGTGNGVPNYAAGGGGGASAVGANASTINGGNGGAGSASSITGSSVTYAGGGGAGAYTGTAGSGGAGGGGNGAAGTTGALSGGSGTANLGGGGGGIGGAGGAGSGTGGSGGSGVVIISYAGSQVFNGGLVTSSGGNTIHTFLASGALTPLTNNLNNSLRFRASASAYLNRTPASTPTSWTLSLWVKRGTLGSQQALVYSRQAGTISTGLFFNASDQLEFNFTTVSVVTSAVFRDPSAWYHVVTNYNGTTYNIYVNGNQQTTTGSSTGANTFMNSSASVVNAIGKYGDYAGYYLDGYLADVNFIDGQVLAPYYFGNNDSYGNWKPIKYTGMYGTNGFYLTFADTSALTTSSNAGLGKDTSGNGNYWTTNNISITTGTTYDAMTDVPTNTSATVANYAVLNPLALNTSQTSLTEGNLYAIPTSGASNWGTAFSTIAIPTSGKYYIEATATVYAGSGNNSSLGVVDSATFIPTNSAILYQYTTGEGFDGILCHLFSDYVAPIDDGVQGTNVTGITGTSVNLMLALDVDNGKVYAGYNGTWLNSGNPAGGTGQVATRTFSSTDVVAGNTSYNGTNDQAQYYNFGQRPFSYTPPTGFVALNTYNLPTPTILQGNKYMDATLWTGVGPASQVIVNQALFKPDLVWVKNRSSTRKHNLYDSVRGTSKRLVSNDTAAEDTVAGVTAFNSNGMTLGDEGDVNANALTFVGWQWQAGQGSTSSNTSGSITSTVSVNTTAGFSIVSYTGNGTSGATVGHGLGVAPTFVIVKERGSGGSGAWATKFPGATATQYLALNETSAAVTTNSYFTANPSSTLIYLGSSSTNVSGEGMIAYCWTPIAGFSSFGSYTGNGSADGVFVYTGFLPKYIMIKSSSIAGEWAIYDIPRDLYNPMGLGGGRLQANTANAETGADSAQYIDFLSNGFKIRNTSGFDNQSSATYIFAAFASNPFKNSNAF